MRKWAQKQAFDKGEAMKKLLLLLATYISSCEVQFGDDFCKVNPTNENCITQHHDGYITDSQSDAFQNETSTDSSETNTEEIAEIDEDVDDTNDSTTLEDIDETTIAEEIETTDVEDTDVSEITEVIECTTPDDCSGTLPACKLHGCIDNLCVVITDDDGAPCNDGNTCTQNDFCASGTCQSGTTVCECTTTDDCALKEDNNLCNGTLICTEGTCIIDQSTIINCTMDDQCIVAQCNPENGNCDTINKNCDDGSNCTEDSCNNGVCNNIVNEQFCDDENPCTAETCEETGCVYTYLTSPCNDNIPCTIGDICKDGTCSGKEKKCDDGNICTDDTCENGTCVFTSNNAQCDDLSECSIGDACIEGNCTGTIDGTCFCNSDNDCKPLDTDFNVCNGTYLCVDHSCIPNNSPVNCEDTGNPCTQNTCNPITGECRLTSINEQLPCNIGEKCKTNTVCSDGTCDGNSIICNDQNTCTSDTCDNTIGCVFVKLNLVACNDDDPCTLADMCANGVCNSVKLVCDDGIPCTSDACSLGNCTYTPQDNTCKDSTPCGSFICDKTKGCIIKSLPETCDDNNPCTTDSCTNEGCSHKPFENTCNDNNACTINDSCVSGTCVGENKNCDDGVECTNDSCNNNLCIHQTINTACDDGKECTLDTCSTSGCNNVASNTLCNDANPCTNDICSTTGCTHTNITMGACDDNNPCTTNDVCALGICTGVKICECATTNDCTAKEDGNLCNGTLMCDISTFPYTCKVDVTTIKTCDPSLNTECLEKQCNPINGNCSFTAIHDALPCNDGDACTVDEYCNNGSCTPFIPKDCNDQNECTLDACNTETGCTHNAQNFNNCDDGNFSTTFDTCVQSVCTGVIPFYEDGNGDTSDWTFASNNATFGIWKFMDDSFNPIAPDPTKVLRFLTQGTQSIQFGSNVVATATSPTFEIPKTATPTLTLWRIGNTKCEYGKVEILINTTKVDEVCGDTINWAKYTYTLPTNVPSANLTLRYTFYAGVAIPQDALWYRFDLFKTNP